MPPRRKPYLTTKTLHHDFAYFEMDSQRNGTQKSNMGGITKNRRRPAFSCVPCHRRKLKCDREYPACERCRKSGHSHDCIYRERSFHHPTAGNKQLILGSLVTNIQPPGAEKGTVTHPNVTENNMSSLKYERSRHGQAQQHDGSRVPEVAIYKGKDACTKFYGYSYHRNLYQQVAHHEPDPGCC